MVKDDAGQTDFYFRWKKSRLFYIFFGCTILHPEDRERERKREKESIVSRHRHAAPTQQSLAHWQRSICGWHHHLPYASFQQKPKTKDSLNLFKADVVVCVCVYMLFFPPAASSPSSFGYFFGCLLLLWLSSSLSSYAYGYVFFFSRTNKER